MFRTAPIAAMALLVVPLCAAGCGRSASMGEARGTVTLDDKPIDDGIIRFVSADGQAGTAGGVIKDGQFAVTLKPASYRVQISATQLSAGAREQNRHSEANYSARELIPEKYNAKTELVLDVKPGSNQRDFLLKSR